MARKFWQRVRAWLGLKPDRDQFAADVLAMAADLGEKGTYDPATFTIELGSGVRHDLRNHYDDVCREPRRQDAIVARYLASIAEGRDVELDAEEVRERLMPVLRHPIKPLLRPGESYGTQGVFDFAGVMELKLVVDLEHSMRWVGDADLERWNMTREGALSQAVDNLARYADPQWRQLRPGLWQSDWNDDYDSSLILLDATWSNLPIQGSPVALVAARGILLIADDADDGALAELVRVGEKHFANDNRRISAVPLQKIEGGWEHFDTSRPEPGRRALAKLRRMGVGTLYGEQKEQLEEQQRQRGGTGPFIASFSGIERDGQLETYCVWGSSIVSLLPVTDRIHFFDEATESVVGDCLWKDFEAVAGDTWKRLDWLPERYLTQKFPDLELLASLTKPERMARLRERNAARKEKGRVGE